MTLTSSSPSIISLHDILNYHDDWLTFPLFTQKPHPHQTFLIWLIKNTIPKTIAIFDTEKNNTQNNICNLINCLKISSQCYGNTTEPTNNLLPETLIPLAPELTISYFSFIYIDISNQIIKNDPILSSIEKNIPEDIIFVFTNLYSQNSMAKENQKIINQWKESYPYFELPHHDGLLTLYTGIPSSQALKELFALKNSPKQEQNFKTYCSIFDDYWHLKTKSIQAENTNFKEKIIVAKTETYLLQQKNYYQEKTHINENNLLNKKTDFLIKKNNFLIEKNNLLIKKNNFLIERNGLLSRKNSLSAKENNSLINKNKSLTKRTDLLSNKNSFLTKKIDWLSNKNSFLTKKIDSLSNKNTFLTKKINLLIEKNNSLTFQLQKHDTTYYQLSVWQQSVKEKIKSIHYLLNKYRIIFFLLPKKLNQLLTFPSTPPELISISELNKSISNTPNDILNDDIPDDILNDDIPDDILNDDIPDDILNDDIPDDILNDDIPDDILNDDIPDDILNDDIPDDILNDIPDDILSVESTQQETLFHHQRIIFIAGEPNTPGTIYRCYRNAEACIMAGYEAKVINAANVSPDDIKWADVLILWRVEFSGHILGIVELAKEYNKLTAFDADDIVFKPHFAYIEIIDGIRTIGTTEAETSRTFGNMKQTLMRTDFAVATTQEMREHMAQELIPKHAGPLVFTLPNIFDDECVRISRFFSRIQKASKNDHYIRIGYASGTRTHQRDFALVIPALIEIFKKRPDVRLVLFREPENHRPILHMNEFPELNDFQDRIEWRDTVPLTQLPQELARFDISIAPLEADNVFCNAKSELKFFEAALANVCSVVSPTGPLSRCIQHGITGFLANNTQEWEEYLLKLIDDSSLRQEIAQKAYHDVLWNFSMQRQSHLCDTMLLSLTDEKGAAQAMETMIARKGHKSLSLPVVPESELLFDHDDLQESEVTVVITSYNYSNFIIEAMESVKAQTLKYIDMIIVDDGSSDDSVELILAWAKEHKNRFNRLQLHRSLKNAGLGGARNIGIAASETLYSMQLDADNRLLPDTCEKLLAQMRGTAIGYAYPHLRHFGAGDATGGHIPFHPLRLTVGNYIDAMVMLAKWAWAAVGGYYVQRDAMGWEDYDIWCRLAELGIQGTQVKEAIAEYRAHSSSMTNTVTEQTHHKPKVVSYLAERHPWLKIVFPEDSPWIKKNKN